MVVGDTVAYRDAQQAARLASEGLQLGFDLLVFSVTVDGNARALKPPPISPPPFAGLRHRLRPVKSLVDVLGLANGGTLGRHLTRVTVDLRGANIVALNQLAKEGAYDLVAIRPMDEAAFSAILQKADFDICCLDLSGGSMPFAIKRHHLGQLARRGIAVELALADAIRDATARRNFFRHAQAIVRFMPHDRILLSSHASEPLGMRSANDTACVARLLGLDDVSSDVMSENFLKTLYRAAARRTAGGIVGMTML